MVEPDLPEDDSIVDWDRVRANLALSPQERMERYMAACAEYVRFLNEVELAKTRLTHPDPQ